MLQNQREALASLIEEARQRRRVPGAAFGVLYGDEVYTAGFGVTSIENPLLVNTDTLFQVGSITKTFTGTTAMILVEQGKLDLDTPLRTYLPDLKLSSEELTAQVTLRHLFTHTGGWEGDFFDDYGNGDDALGQYVANMGELEQFAPLGTLWSYNNAGLNLAGHVIEVVAGKPYEAVVKELVFDPLGMTRTTFFPAEAMLHRFCVGHHPSDPPTVARPWPIARTSNPAGAISSTINDLLKYARFYLSGGVTESGTRLLKTETIAYMQSALVTVAKQRGSVGITWFLRDIQNVHLVGHDGSTNGFNAEFELVPAQGFAFIGLTNSGSGSELSNEIMGWTLKTLFGVQEQPPELITVPEETLADYAGTFRATLTQCEISLKDGELWLQFRLLGGMPTRKSPPPDVPPPPPSRMAFYDQDCGIMLDPPLKGMRVQYLRDDSGAIRWLLASGRVHRPIEAE